MKKEARLLHNKAVDSLVLSIEFFNRPVERARADSVLILMDHAFETLLKAAIVHQGGRIRARRDCAPENAAIKIIAEFANSEFGGTVLISVADDGTVHCLGEC